MSVKEKTCNHKICRLLAVFDTVTGRVEGSLSKIQRLAG